MILAGDVGGTKTRLAVYSLSNEKLQKLEEEQFISSDFKNIKDIINLFNDKHKLIISKGCIGVPGPVQNRKAIITNLPWELSEAEIEKHTSIKQFKLVNDLTATAAAVPFLSNADLLEIYSGKSTTSGNMSSVIAPGTGLGQAFLLRDNENYIVIPSEGGHSGFSACDNIQLELHAYLLDKYERVSVESVLCGPGIVNIFNFIIDSHKDSISTKLANELKNATDKAAIISKYALENKDPACSKAIEIFLSILGSHAGDMVLNTLSTSGVYLGGGIPPKLISKVNAKFVVESFLNKGKLSYIVKDTPIYVIKDDRAALLGAAHLASKL